jgi:hypothetical protein
MTMSRLLSVVLATTPFLPWYTSEAKIDRDTYIGNPLPLVDWLVVALAVAALVRVRLARVAALSALVSVGLTLLAAYVDFAEGISVTPNYGMAVTAVVGALLLGTASGHTATLLRSVLAAIRQKLTPE